MIINNNIAFTPRGAKDYGVYVCHATSKFGSTAYEITLTEGHKSSGSTKATKEDDSEYCRYLKKANLVSRALFSSDVGLAKRSNFKESRALGKEGTQRLKFIF